MISKYLRLPKVGIHMGKLKFVMYMMATGTVFFYFN
jgi:hypothetical protein